MRKIILILVFVLLGIARLGYCFDVTVSYSDFIGSSSRSVVQSACDTVLANGGGNVYLPAGTSGVWTGALNIQGGVNLIGAGSPMTSRQTITSYGLNLPQGQWTPAPTTIIRNGTDTNAFFIMMNYPTYTTGKVRIANIKFVEASGHVGRYIQPYYNVQGFRIDHCEFQGSNRAIYIYPAAGTLGNYGVVDHCNFIEQWDYTFNIEGRFGTWADNVPLGMDNDKAIYIEDCFFTKQGYNSGHPVGSFGGAKWVFRYNTVFQYPGYAQGGLDAHGASYGWCSGGPGCPRGAGPWEIYNNYFIYDPTYEGGNMAWTSAGLRSGYGVIHHNYYYNLRYAVLFEMDPDPCAGSGSISLGLDAPGHSGDPVKGYHGHVYIWSNSYSNVTGDGVNPYYYFDASCVQTYVKLGVDILGYQDGIGGNTGVARPGYTAYTYPHPLVSGAQSLLQNPPPNSPKNLRIINP